MRPLADEARNARIYRDGIVPPSPQLRALRFSMPTAREGQRIYYAGRWWVYELNDWWIEKNRATLTPDQLAQARTTGSAAQRKHDAAPSWQDFIDLWGESGAVRNERGQVVGYRYPQYADPEKAARVKHQVVELWKRHMEVGTDIGMEESARYEPVTLVDRSTGATTTVHPLAAEKKAKKMGMVERRKTRLKATHGHKGGRR